MNSRSSRRLTWIVKTLGSVDGRAGLSGDLLDL